MVRRVSIVFVICCICAAAVRAEVGTVKTLQGQTFTGQLTRNSDGSITVTVHGIDTRIDPGDVAVVLPAVNLDDEFAARLSHLSVTDVRGRIDLADWANQNNRPDLAVRVLEQARQIDPSNQAAATALAAVNRQMELDESRSPAAGSATPTSGPANRFAGAPATAPAEETPLAVRRQLLDEEQINILRQKELADDDTDVRIVFRGDVVNRYLAGRDRDPAAFRAMPLVQQAREIVASGDPTLARDVRVVSDPRSIRDYRQHVNVILTTGCGTLGCHGGTGAGDFHLYNNDMPNAAYTNFYILQKYSALVGGVREFAVDRTVPERSLVLQFGLPTDLAAAAHPPAPDYRPRFRTPSDLGYRQVLEWITADLSPVLPSYGIAASPYFRMGSTPATRSSRPPVSTAAAAPATRP